MLRISPWIGFSRLYGLIHFFILGPTRVLFYLTFFISLSLIGNLIQIFSLIFLQYPACMKLHSHLCGLVWICMQFVFECMHGAKITVTGFEQLCDGENAIVIANHHAYTDFYLIHHLATRCHMISHCKYFLKDSLKYIPGYGWGMWMMNMIFLKRTFREDQKTIRECLRQLKSTGNPYWLILYPEGRRSTPKHLRESQEYAMSHSKPHLEYTLLPRSKGLQLTLEEMRSNGTKYLYDVTMIARHAKKGFNCMPSLIDVHYSGDLRQYQFHVHIEKYAISSLPHEEAELKKWLQSVFVDKNNRIDQWKQQWRSGQSLPWTFSLF